MPRLLIATFAVALILVAAQAALAGGGPHNVLVVANAASEDSVAVANAYLAARGIPGRNLCRLNIPLEEFRWQDILKAERFETLVVAPLKAFLAQHPAPDRLHFIVLCPDLPLRVDFPQPVGPRSLPAALTLLGTNVGPNPAPNPYLNRTGAFGQLVPAGDAIGRMRLVTVLRGYQRRDALDLITRSLAADGTAPKGSFRFVPSQHTRGYEQAVAWLTAQSFEAVLGEKDKPLADVKDVMAYFSGGSYSGLTPADVATNTYRSGAVVDMLESYGVNWPNWRGFAQLRQLPVAWFVRSGATGVHGTTDEPYAGAFPSSGYSQTFFANYTSGGNLAEAFWSAIPTLQWQNAVFGDPLCAPYAVRPKVAIDKVDASSVAAAVIHGSAVAPKEAQLFIDGRFIARTDAFMTREAGVANCSFDLAAAAALVPGTHRVRVVAVDASPQAVQGWAVADLAVGPAVAAPAIALAEPKLPPAAGDSLRVTCSRRDASGAVKVELWAGAMNIGAFTADALAVDTARLGPGRHELQARSLDASGKLVALSNVLKLDLAEPLYVLDLLPDAATGTQPIFYLRYSAPLPFAEAVVRQSVHLQQGSLTVPVRTSVDGPRLVIEPAKALRGGTPCTLKVAFPQSAARSRDVVREFTPSADARLLYTMPSDVRDASTVEGLISCQDQVISPIWKTTAVVVLGPVDLYLPNRPARWSLPSCTVSAQMTIGETARPQGKDKAGAGLGLMYSDINNRCYVRIEREGVVVYQVLGGKTTRLAAWFLPGTPVGTPGKTSGVFQMELQAAGPQLAVLVDGRKLGTAEVDRKLPPGLPWVDLGAAAGISARDIKVSR